MVDDNDDGSAADAAGVRPTKAQVVEALEIYASSKQPCSRCGRLFTCNCPQVDDAGVPPTRPRPQWRRAVCPVCAVETKHYSAGNGLGWICDRCEPAPFPEVHDQALDLQAGSRGLSVAETIKRYGVTRPTFDLDAPRDVDALAQLLTLIRFHGDGAPGVPPGLFDAFNRSHFNEAAIMDPEMPIEVLAAPDRELVARLRRIKHGAPK